MLTNLVVMAVAIVIMSGIMYVVNTNHNKAGVYAAQVKNTVAMMSNLENATKFYYINKDSYNGLTMDYYKDFGVNKQNYVEQADGESMSSDDWDGFPADLPDPYTGPYMEVGGPAHDEMRVVVLPLDNGQSFGIYLLKKKENSVPAEFTKMLEKTLATTTDFVGG